MTPPTETEKAGARRRRLSASALVAAAALGPLLIGSVVYGHRAVTRASQSVLRGEAEAWTRQLGSRLREQQGPPTQTLLASMLEEEHPDGLRYIGYFSNERRVEAGTPATPFTPADLVSGEVKWVGPLVRHAMSIRRGPRGMGPRRDGEPPRGDGEAPPRPPGEPPRLEGEPPRPPDHMRPPGPPPGPPPRFGGPGEPPRPPRQIWVVVEFEPRTWGELNSTSRATLAVGSVTALAVCFLALWAWRSSQRVLSIERETARARHLAALGEMSAVLAHEIRNPLTSLKGHSQLLVESLSSLGLEKPRGKAERVVSEALRLEQITNDLLDFVKQGELDRAPTDLGQLLQQAVSEAVPADRLVLVLPEEGVTLPVDASKLRHLLGNLVQNAVQAADGPVEVDLAVEETEVVLTVRDHGPGIPAGQEDRIFEPFVTTRVRGTGLGLAIARRIADRHGGTLTASNHPKGGALFRLTLPRS
jgi:two-component system, NtrC family, sensor histidine kinase HydH